jgi:hypothetical protein
MAVAVAIFGGCFAQVDSRELTVTPTSDAADVSVGADTSIEDVSVRSDVRPDTSLNATDGGPVADRRDADVSDGAPPIDGNPSDASVRDVAVARDGAITDAIADADARVSDGPTDVAIAPDASWNDFTVTANWEAVSIGIGTGVAGAGSFQGGAFDGRYVYFAPSYHSGLLARYDTLVPFGIATSWAHLDLATVDPRLGGDAQARTFAGALFDGRYLYLIPFETQAAPGGLVLQCDTTLPGGCIAPASWSTFSLAFLVGSPCGYAGAVFDGRYVTLVPFLEPQSGGPFTTLARFDTQAPGGFTAGTSWSTLQISLAVPSAGAFTGGIFDGRRLYLMTPPSNQSLVTIYDTTRPLNDFGAWSGLDLASDAGVGQLGGGFDGRYVYASPAARLPTLTPTVARCDTQSDGGCGAASSWARFSVGPLNAADAAGEQYMGSAFDGRYLYFPPYAATTVALRFDTTLSFTALTSWSRFDLSRLPAGAFGFFGSVFDGEYVYFVPATGQSFVRFHARQPAAAPGPPTWGSFY